MSGVTAFLKANPAVRSARERAERRPGRTRSTKLIRPCAFLCFFAGRLLPAVQLVPLFACVGAGVVGSAFYIARMGIKGPDVVINRKTNPFPWQNVAPNQNTKFMAVNQKFEETARPAF